MSSRLPAPVATDLDALLDPQRPELREGARNALLCGLLWLPALGFVWALFEPIVPRTVLRGWSLPTALLSLALLGWCAAVLAMPAMRGRLWQGAGTVLVLAWCTALAAATWGLLPYAAEGLRLTLLVFLGAVLLAQATWSFLPLPAYAGSVLLVLGAVGSALLEAGVPYAGTALVFLVCLAVLLVATAHGLHRLERRSRETAATLALTAAERSRALQRLTQERDAKMRFLVATTHDLRQPLQAAALFLERLLSTADAVEKQTAARGLGEAFSAVDGLLDQLLDHLRLETGAVRPRLQAVDPVPLLQRLHRRHAPEAERAGIRLRAAGRAPLLVADPVLLERALSNLLVNALRHSRGERVLLLARRRQGTVQLYVLDDGVGVPAEERGPVWREYHQGSGARGRPASGLGLGLASSRRLAELMGGAAGHDHRWQDGSAFWLQLPAA